MKFGSIGIRAASPSVRYDDRRWQEGFTLIEALVALSLLLSFAMTLGPLLFQARHIFTQGHGEIRAQILLRSLLQAPFAHSPNIGLREGNSQGLLWRVDVEPFIDDSGAVDVPRVTTKNAHPYDWTLYRVSANVSWGAGRSVAAETLRLGQVK
ncbi:prepilin-type N-terminal cleavage/methylation domain-containing protein [Methylovirgula sp. HY1]|uniref:prepilin-type N-terminal cleavage/methylation domain-containing protein n=1 Tax=Methylovirgula sp. HY1 TaxID=2822761 RepID=UPI001C5AF68D|nr:prepilin-type N-terminal cleavage/methylation domain-containing protein [Methylovirgula sp. HY1]QXX76273.1 hypothetical protein MHY1_03113 [Methylovirgula sp. HY1]